jgi:ADP-heptose:LPS heptosyltransferase
MSQGGAPLAASYSRGLEKQELVGYLLNAASAITPRVRGSDFEKPNRIGVLSQWGIGDAVLLLPLLRGLRNSFPLASLELIGKAWLPQLLANENCCDRTHLLVPPWTAYVRKYRPTFSQISSYWSQIRSLRREQFDWLISARFDPREVVQLRLLRAKKTYGFQSAGGRYWITNDLGITRAVHDSVHRAELAVKVLAAIGGAAPDSSVFFRCDTKRQNTARDWLASQGYNNGGVLAVHTGAGHPIRRWRESHFDSVIRGLSVKPGFIVFIEDPESEKVTWSGSLPHVHWTGDISDLKMVLSACDVFLGTDSGIMHMAAAAGCEVVAAFGPTEPRWFGPAGTRHSVIIDDMMPCRPCFDECIYSAAVCMQNISDRVVIEAVDNSLRKAAASAPAAT